MRGNPNTPPLRPIQVPTSDFRLQQGNLVMRSQSHLRMSKILLEIVLGLGIS